MRSSVTFAGEEDMTKLKCPYCGNDVGSRRTWAQAAVSALMAAPAVPDMATQVRCPHCGRVSAASDLRPGTADRFTKPHLALWIVGVALAAWAVAEVLLR